jgi:16S rRNA (uracil1498-N3)-methyltransferase
VTAAGPSGRDGPHAFVADLENPELHADDRHHLGRALRLRPGDGFTVSDGRGSWRRCRFGDELAIDGPIVHVERTEPTITVGFALIKGARPELVVQKLTELGVNRIVGFVTQRSIVRWDHDKRLHHHHRWERVAREAAMQSRQVWLPTIDPIRPFEDVADLPGAHLAEPGAAPVDSSVHTVLVGPEGGWTGTELGDRPVVGLGPHVLRAETAAFAAAVRMTALRDDRGP